MARSLRKHDMLHCNGMRQTEKLRPRQKGSTAWTVSAAAPGKSAAAPEKSAAAPEKSAAASGKSAAASGKSAAAEDRAACGQTAGVTFRFF